MGGSNLSVKITADETNLVAKFAIASASVKDLGGTLRATAADALKFGESNAAASQALQQAAENYTRANARLAALRAEMRATSTASSGLGGSLEDVRSKLSQAFAFTGLAVAAEGVMKLGEAVTVLGDRAIEIRTMSMVLDITTDQFQAMSVAGEEAGVSAEVFARASEHLTNMLTEARDGSGKAVEKLHELGITTSDISNKNFQLNDVLAVLKTRLEDVNTAEATRKALLTDLGARTATAIQAIKEYDGSQQGVAGAMAKVNGLSTEQIARLAAMKTGWSELETGIGNSVAKIVAWSGDALAAYKKMVIAKNPQMDAANQGGSGGSVSGTIDRSGSAQVDQAAQDSARAQEAAHNEVLRSEMESIKSGVSAFAAGTAERLAALRQYASIAKQYYGSGNVDEVRKANQEVLVAEREYRQTQGSEAIADARTQAQALQANTSQSLAQRLAAETSIWSKVLASDKLSSAQRLESAREFSREYVEVEKQMTAQAAAITRSDVQADVAIGKLSIDAKKSQLQEELAAEQVNSGQKLAALRQLTASEFALDEQALENELSTLQQGTAEYERVYNEIRVLKAKLVADLAKLDQQGAADAARAAREEVTARKVATNEILSAESTLVGGLIGRRQSLKQTIGQIGAQMVQQEITNDLKAMTMRILIQDQGEAKTKASMQGGLLYHAFIELQKMIATTRSQAGQTTAVVAGDQARLVAQGSAAVEGKAIQKETGGNTVMSDAAKAFSGTYAAIAQIPYVGPFLAPPAAAAAYAAVAGMEGLASLDTGTNWVPRDQLAMIHEGEAVIPKAYNPAAGGSGSGGGDDNSYHEEHHYKGNVSLRAMDTRGLRSLLSSQGNRHEIMQAARRLGRGGGRR